jgi:hypothetical protein
MQYVNDHMDDLFRRAAENYPLDTSKADWNKVLAALQNQQAQSTTIPEKKGNKKSRLLWLLLLLPFGLICNQLYSPGNLNNAGISKLDKAQNNPSSAKNSSQQNNVIEINSPKNGNEITTGVSSDVTNSTGVVNSTGYSTQLHKTSYGAKPAAYNRTTAFDYLVSNNDNSYGNQGINGESGTANEPFSKEYVYEIAVQKSALNRPVVKTDRSLTPAITSSTEQKKANITVTKTKKFYAGLAGGIDATTIKFQKVEDAGFSFGAIFGYQINKKWSVETGAFAEKKYYYSDGKYFNTSKIYMPPNSRIDDVSGNCKMIEVPVLARYNFAMHGLSNWFGAVGISSYFMKQENYTYNYYYGTVGPVPHNKEYKNSSTHLFSNISLSGGYAHRLGNFADVRIEPYLKLPLSGTGIGSLPLFSMGLQLGITKKF